MPLVNECYWTAASAGTGSFVVSAAKTGFFTPAQCTNPAITDGGTYHYRAESADLSEHEIGTGVYTAATTTLTRSTILQSSNSGNAVNFTAAPNVRIVALSQDIPSVGGSDGQIQYNNSSAFGGANLYRTDANTITQKNGTNAQTFYIYNTDDGAGNSEYASFQWFSNEAYFLTQAAGSGVGRNLILRAEGDQLKLGCNSATIIDLAFYSGSYLFQPESDGLFDIGAGRFSGANPGRIYAKECFAISPVAISALPSSPTAGMVATISDGDAGLTWGATAINSGAGATKYLVWYNGSNWTICAK